MKMKLNITVDLQDIFDSQNEQAYYDGENGNCGGGYNLNDAIKNEVILAILGKVSNDCINAVMKKANEKVDVALSNAIDVAVKAIEQKSVDYATEWLENKNIKLTDRWGKVTKETSIQEIVSESFTNTLEKKVDDNGRFTDSYGAKVRLIDYVSTKHIEKCVSERLPEMNYKLDKVIKETLDSYTTELLSKKLKGVLDSANS